MEFDSLIFDLDGTLWDATSTYAQAWCECLREGGSNKVISPDMLLPVMGMEQEKALAQLLPELDENKRNEIYAGVTPRINYLISKIGGHLYPGVKEGVAQLARRYSLFIVSNCPQGLIPAFLKWANFRPYFLGSLAFGDTQHPKSVNIMKLKQHYRLKSPLYIGDTDLDRVQSDLASLPFIFVKYGFGHCQKYMLAFDSFQELVAYLVNPK